MVGKTMIGYFAEFELLVDANEASRKLINADTVFIYDTTFKYRFKDTVDNYGSLLVHLVKFDLGYIGLRYFYPLDQREKVFSAINDTWGIIRFKPDDEFTHPNRENWIPKPEAPDLYFGKFSFLNDPEQVKKEQEQYDQRRQKGRANALANEAAHLARAKDVDQAKEKLAEALAIDSNNVIAYRHLLLISMDENKRDESLMYRDKLIEKDPNNTESWFLKGLLEKKYNELDSAEKTFELLLREKDSLHFRSYVELAFIAIQRGEHEAADLNFNRAIGIFQGEGEKSLRREGHRILNINDLLMVRLAYAQFLNGRSEFEKSKALFEQTLEEERVANEAGEKGERRRIYGKLTPASLGELNFMMAMSYAGLRDELSTLWHLGEAKRLGKVLPEELDQFLGQ